MDWLRWLSESELDPSLVYEYSQLFSKNELDGDDIYLLNHDLLSSIGIKIAKHRVQILRHKNKLSPKPLLPPPPSMQADIIAYLRNSDKMLDESTLLEWLSQTWPRLCTRSGLVSEGYLDEDAPRQGLSLITTSHRSEVGERLLFQGKAMLWAVLYGNVHTNVVLERVERELLSLTVLVNKAHVFNFFEAVTEIGVSGTWRDPGNMSSDENAPNIVLQVEYGEVASELVGDAIMVCIHLINLLEVNEETLYARCANVEQSTLLTRLYFQRGHEDNGATKI